MLFSKFYQVYKAGHPSKYHITVFISLKFLQTVSLVPNAHMILQDKILPYTEINDFAILLGLFGLVSNAEGTAPVGPTDWLRIEDFHSVLDVSLLGLIEITLKLLPLLKKAEGRVVNLINAKGLMAFVGGGYSLSKWGMEAFSDTLR